MLLVLVMRMEKAFPSLAENGCKQVHKDIHNIMQNPGR